jgi:hypothetical protein
VRNAPSTAGRNSEAESPSISPSHAGQSSDSRITGMRLCSSAISAFGSVVTIAKLPKLLLPHS